MANPPGDHSHLIDFPEALEALFSRIGELKLVLGAAAEPALAEVERLLRVAATLAPILVPVCWHVRGRFALGPRPDFGRHRLVHLLLEVGH